MNRVGDNIILVNGNALEVGNVFKSYRDLCNNLMEDIKAGNSKVSQIKEWERNFDYEKKGNKFIILNIKTEQEYNNSLIVEYNAEVTLSNNKKLILDLLSRSENQNETCVFLSINNLLRKLGLVNSEYGYYKHNVPRLSEILQMDSSYIYDFYDVTHSNLKNSIGSALNKLKQEKLIRWGFSYKIGTINNGHRITTQTEEVIILKAERQVLLDLKLETEKEVVDNNKWKEYKDLINKTLETKIKDFSYYYDCYRILFNYDHITQENAKTKYILEDDDRVNISIRNNLAFIKRQKVNLRNRVNKAKDDDLLTNYINNVKKFGTVEKKFKAHVYLRRKKDYIANQNLLIDKLLFTGNSLDKNSN